MDNKTSQNLNKLTILKITEFRNYIMKTQIYLYCYYGVLSKLCENWLTLSPFSNCC